MNRREAILAVSAIGIAPTSVRAQQFPSKPIRLVNPFPPGGSGDQVARSYVQTLSENLGQQVVVDYRGGAGGSIGTGEVARSTPDGYTLVQVWDTHAINHHLLKVTYDFDKSFAPISLLVQAPGVLVASTRFPPASVRELIEFAKANPERVTYGSAGSGSSNHLAGLRFSQMTGTKLTHVPYRGGGPLINDLIAGHVNFCIGTLPLYLPYIRTGQLKALATTARQRVAVLPDMPSLSEFVPGFESKTWFGVLAPAGTPSEVTARLNRAFIATMSAPVVREKLEGLGWEVVASSPDVFSSFLSRESEIAGHLIREFGVKPD